MTSQFALDFAPGLTEQYRTFNEALAAAVYGSRIGLAGVAAECDVSPSALSRMLNENPDDPRHLPAKFIPKIIKATKDNRPIYWLIETFLEDSDTKRRRTIEQAAVLVQQLGPLLKELRK